MQTIQSLTTDLSRKKCFLLFYTQLKLIKNLTENTNKKNVKDKIKKLLDLFLIIMFRRIIFYITSLPFFIIKNNNEITETIFLVLNLNCKSYEAYLTTLCLNLIKNFNLVLNMEINNKKINFNKKKIFLNPLKYDEILNKIKALDKLNTGSKILINNGNLAMIKYKQEKGYLKSHASLFYENYKDQKKSTYLIINQTTKKHTSVKNVIENDFMQQTNIEHELVVRGILKQNLDAFNVTPHTVQKEITEIVSSKKLINQWTKTENWIKQFNFVNSFIINLEKKMLTIDKKHGLIVDDNYKNVRDYLEKNYIYFDKDVQLGLEKIVYFYDSNKELFENNNNKLNFVKCLYLTEVNKEVAQFFKNIIFKY